MKDYEKKCPLMQMTCYEEECALWYAGKCSIKALVEKAERISDELYQVRKELDLR